MDFNKNYYQILGVSKTASDNDIRTAYRKLAVKNHPDKNNGNKESENIFKNLNEAYQILSDNTQKHQYDQQSPHGNNYNPNANQFGFNPFAGFGGNDIFEQIFKKGFRGFGEYAHYTGGNEQFRENLDISTTVNVNFSNVYMNEPITVSYQRYVSCEVCEGTGFDPESESFDCEMCDGTGKNFKGVVCEQCNGKGKIFSATCKKCNGEKIQLKKESFQLNNTFQVNSSIQLRKAEYGHQSKYYRTKRGSLLINIVYEGDNAYKVSTRGLEHVMNIHYEDAIHGAKVKLKLPDSKTYEVKIPPKTKDNDVIRIQNMGTYTFDGKTRTDLYVTINIVIDYDRVD